MSGNWSSHQIVIHIFILNPLIKVKNIKSIDTVITISSGLLLVGLQTHLKRKLEYITHEHPFRIFQVFEN